MGGGIALRQAVANPNYDAAAIWYGDVGPVIGDAGDISLPLLGSYGGRDTSIPAEDVRNFESALTDKHDIKIYDDAGHAFFDDTRSSYVASAAADAWKRTLAWFAKYLHG
jgi:carboxymethylenebutenolidase